MLGPDQVSNADAADQGDFALPRIRPEAIARTLRREILIGVHPPGARLPERQIAERFAVSRGPVREALRLLAQERLVALEVYRGARVAQLSREEIIDMFELRAALLALAARLAAERASPDQIARFAAAVRVLADLAAAGAPADVLVKQGSIASALLVDASGSPELRAVLNEVSRKSRWHYTQIGLQRLGAAIEAARNWRRAADRVVARDGPGAEAALRETLRFVQNRALEVLDGERRGKTPRAHSARRDSPVRRVKRGHRGHPSNPNANPAVWDGKE